MSNQVLVVAIGGNSLIKDARHQTVPDQIAALAETSVHIAAAIRDFLREPAAAASAAFV